jgi:hypothetical protein
VQYDDHVNAWRLWRIIGQQHDDHVWAWRSHETQLRGFYAHLVRHQEPLGMEFERVLHDNLFELYAR